MSFRLRFKALFFGSIIGLAIVTRLAFAGLFGHLGSVADYAAALVILIAIFIAPRLSEPVNRFYAQRTARRLLEEGFVKWASQVEARKSAAVSAQSVKETGNNSENRPHPFGLNG